VAKIARPQNLEPSHAKSSESWLLTEVAANAWLFILGWTGITTQLRTTVPRVLSASRVG